MIGRIVNALVVGGIVFWVLDGEELPVREMLLLFVVLLTNFELISLHRKVSKVLKNQKRRMNNG